MRLLICNLMAKNLKSHVICLSEIQVLKLSIGISISLYSYKRTVKLRQIVLFLPLNAVFQPSRLHGIECNSDYRLCIVKAVVERGG